MVHAAGLERSEPIEGDADAAKTDFERLKLVGGNRKTKNKIAREREISRGFVGEADDQRYLVHGARLDRPIRRALPGFRDHGIDHPSSSGSGMEKINAKVSAPRSASAASPSEYTASSTVSATERMMRVGRVK